MRIGRKGVFLLLFLGRLYIPWMWWPIDACCRMLTSSAKHTAYWSTRGTRVLSRHTNPGFGTRKSRQRTRLLRREEHKRRSERTTERHPMTRPFCLLATKHLYPKSAISHPAGITVLLQSSFPTYTPAILDICRLALLDSYTCAVRESLTPREVLVVMSIGRAYMQTIAQSSMILRQTRSLYSIASTSRSIHSPGSSIILHRKSAQTAA